MELVIKFEDVEMTVGDNFEELKASEQMIIVKRFLKDYSPVVEVVPKEEDGSTL